MWSNSQLQTWEVSTGLAFELQLGLGPSAVRPMFQSSGLDSLADGGCQKQPVEAKEFSKQPATNQLDLH